LSDDETLKEVILVKLVKKVQSTKHKSQFEIETDVTVWAEVAKANRSILILVNRLGQFRINLAIFCFPITLEGIMVSLAFGVKVNAPIVFLLVNLPNIVLTVATETRLHVISVEEFQAGPLQMHGATLVRQLGAASRGLSCPFVTGELPVTITATTLKIIQRIFNTFEHNGQLLFNEFSIHLNINRMHPYFIIMYNKILGNLWTVSM